MSGEIVGASISANATGTLKSGNGVLYSVGLCSGADAANVTIRRGGSGGTVICRLGVAAANTPAQRLYIKGVAFTGDLHLTVDAGTTPRVDVEVA